MAGRRTCHCSWLVGGFAAAAAIAYALGHATRAAAASRYVNALRSLAAELAGLFVEDRFFALAVAVWLAFIIATTPLWNAAPLARGIALFCGLAAIAASSAPYKGARDR